VTNFPFHNLMRMNLNQTINTSITYEMDMAIQKARLVLCQLFPTSHTKVQQFSVENLLWDVSCSFTLLWNMIQRGNQLTLFPLLLQQTVYHNWHNKATTSRKVDGFDSKLVLNRQKSCTAYIFCKCLQCFDIVGWATGL